MQIKEGQTAVITGAGSGIGKALALDCANYGMCVVAADIELDAAEKTVAEITANGGEALAIKVDVSNPDDITALAELAWHQFGGCQLLCNNAGVAVEKPLDECSHADWQWVINVNLMGVANAVAAFVPRLKEQSGPAHIVNTASMAGLAPLPMAGPYVASKYAVVGLSETLNTELAETEIGVSVLCPGAVATRIFESERNRPNYQEPPLKEEMTLDEMGLSLDEAYRRVLDPQQVAKITLEAVRNNQLYIITHTEWRPLFSKRADAINAAFETSRATL